VDVRRVEVRGNTLLPASVLDTAVAPAIGPARSFSDLQAAAAAVQSAYARAGYGGVVAYLPEQAPQDDTLVVQVIEGRLARVSVTGQKAFSAEGVRRALPALHEGSTPQVRRIDAQMQLANENPARQMQLLLQPGAQPGEVDASVTVQEHPPQTWSVALDNTGNERTGRWRASLGWQHANLWDLAHVMSAQFTTSPSDPSKVRVFSAGYRAPLPTLLSMVDVYAAYSDVEAATTATFVGDLSFNGKGRLYGVRLSRAFERIATVDPRLALSLERRDYLNNCSITGLPDGACGSAGASVSVQPLSVELALQGSQAPRWSLSAALSRNLQWGGGRSSDAHVEAVRPGANPHYQVFKAAATLALELPADLALQWRAAGQWTDHALVPGEQFGLGGVASVRGYEERELAGDRGIAMSVELGSPPLWPARMPAGAMVKAVTFIDGGGVHNKLGTPCRNDTPRCDVWSAGVGVRAEGRNWQAALFVANARRGAIRTDRGDTRAHVAMSISF
jgi:hemolysin activation/secretion protein